MPVIVHTSQGESKPVCVSLTLTNSAQIGFDLTGCSYAVKAVPDTARPLATEPGWYPPDAITAVGTTGVRLFFVVGVTGLVVGLGDDWVWVRVSKPDGTYELIRITEDQLDIQ